MATASEPAAAATPARQPAQEPAPLRSGRFTASLRFRLTLYYVALLAAGSLLLLLFINTAAHIATSSLTIDIPTPTGQTDFDARTIQSINAAEQQARQSALDRLHILSVVGFLVLIGGGIAGGAFVAGRALEPIGEMSRVARRISSTNLKERIALGGPDDELKQLADAFDDMVARLDDSFERQRQFIADASHELRTPLTALQLNLDAVRSDPDATAEDYRAVAEETAAATTRMRRLIEDLLALAALGENQRATGRVEMSSLAEDVVEELEPVAAEHGVRVASAVPPGVVATGDALSLRRALINLLENAIRYNRPGGHAMIESVSAPPGHIALAIRDDGVGIPAEALPHVFDRFFRVDKGRSRAEGGSGLGLSIVARIATEHGGTVEVESSLGEGSRFTLTIPGEAPSPGLRAADGSAGDDAESENAEAGDTEGGSPDGA